MVACILPGKSVQLCQNSPRGKVILHPRRHVGQVRIPPARVVDGRAEQHTRHPQDEQLHLHVSGKKHPKFSRRQLHAVVVEVRDIVCVSR